MVFQGFESSEDLQKIYRVSLKKPAHLVEDEWTAEEWNEKAVEDTCYLYLPGKKKFYTCYAAQYHS